MKLDRRAMMGALLAGALGTTLAAALGQRAHAAPGKVKRLFILNFPDGVPNPAGGPDMWWPSDAGGALTLAPAMTPLEPHKKQLLFFRGLSMGGTDEGSHPGGAKKLLTGVDGGAGVSIDRHLASTIGKSAPFPHLYLGAQAAANNASGDKFVSYPAAGTTAAPIDDPFTAYKMLFGSGVSAGQGGQAGGGGAAGAPVDQRKKSAVAVLLSDLGDLKGRLGEAEQARLELHRDALDQLDKRLTQLATPPMGAGGAAATGCAPPMLKLAATDATGLGKPELFPAISRAQIDLMVAAMACGLSRIGVLQLSQHTSELVMSRFEGTELYTPNFDMRSHQASHYGDPSDPKFTSYVAERRWFMGEVAYLLQRLGQLPEDGATMLDHTLVLVCTEVCDGNTHLHRDMPFFLAGGGAGGVSTGKILSLGERRHGDLLATVAQALGSDITSFGVGSSGPIASVFG